MKTELYPVEVRFRCDAALNRVCETLARQSVQHKSDIIRDALRVYPPVRALLARVDRENLSSSGSPGETNPPPSPAPGAGTSGRRSRRTRLPK